MIITAIMLIRLITSILRTEIETDASWKKEFKSKRTRVESLHPRFGGVEQNSTWICANANHSSGWQNEEPCWLAEVTWTDEDLQWLVPLKMMYEWGEWKHKLHLKLEEERKKMFCVSHKRAIDKFLGACRMFVWPGCTFLPACLTLLKFWEM